MSAADFSRRWFRDTTSALWLAFALFTAVAWSVAFIVGPDDAKHRDVVVVAGPANVSPLDGTPSVREQTAAITVSATTTTALVPAAYTTPVSGYCTVPDTTNVYKVAETATTTTTGDGPYCTTCVAGARIPIAGRAWARTSAGSASLRCAFVDGGLGFVASTSSSSSGNLDTTYLRLDTTNDPLTDSLSIEKAQNATTSLNVLNTTNGTGAGSEVRMTGTSAGSADYLAAGYGSASNSTPEFADAAYLSAGTATSGMSLIVGDTAKSFRWYFGSPPSTSEKMRLTTTGLGIGTTAPSEKLEVSDATLARVLAKSDADAQIELRSASGPSSYSAQTMYSARGTQAALTASQNGDTLGGLFIGGHNGTFYSARTKLIAVATQNWAVGAQGSGLVAYVDKNGTATSTEAMRLVGAEAVFNDSAADIDFRVEGLTEPNLVNVDASTDCVGLGGACAAGIGSTLEVFNAAGDFVAALGTSSGATQSILGANDTSGTIGALLQLPRSVGTTVGTLPSCNASANGAMVYVDDTDDGKPAALCICSTDAGGAFAWNGFIPSTGGVATCPI